ncbi:YybH family protein [Methylogaea oryzae]|uniref:SnoaL-like domain-containing protein n=1 Tax=Methylogaea oryzae TaxID=1295382 RepID=A0A8D4VLR2_9GAMM|nr:nuclear transport factor 2 family protein [Methylogaea oryzae]BBL70173.1 hypothetical protein MoryE10_07790 [Methylogaea oryzae]
MNRRPIRCLACAVALLAATPADAEEPAQRIAEADLAGWNSAMSRGRPDDIPSLLTGDAMLIAPDGGASHGGDSIRRFWESLMAMRNGHYRLKLLTARRENADTVVSRAELIGAAPLGKAGNVITYRYQGLLHHVLKRTPDGAWRVQVQRWRSEESR